MAGHLDYEPAEVRRDLRRLTYEHRSIIALRDICTGPQRGNLIYKDCWDKTVKEHANVSGKILGPRANAYLDASRRKLKQYGYIEYVDGDLEVVKITKKWEIVLQQINNEVSELCTHLITFLQVFRTVRPKFAKLKALTRRDLETENRKLRRENAELREPPNVAMVLDTPIRCEFGVQAEFDPDDTLDMDNDLFVTSTSSGTIHSFRGNVLFSNPSTSTPLRKLGSLNDPAAYPSPPVTPESRGTSPVQGGSPIAHARSHNELSVGRPSIAPRDSSPFVGGDEDSPMYDEDGTSTSPGIELADISIHTPAEPQSKNQSRLRISFPFSPLALYRAYKARDAYKRQAIKSKADLRKTNKKVGDLTTELREKSQALEEFNAQEQSNLSLLETDLEKVASHIQSMKMAAAMKGAGRRLFK